MQPAIIPQVVHATRNTDRDDAAFIHFTVIADLANDLHDPVILNAKRLAKITGPAEQALKSVQSRDRAVKAAKAASRPTREPAAAGAGRGRVAAGKKSRNGGSAAKRRR